jgi:hypothetical protein
VAPKLTRSSSSGGAGGGPKASALEPLALEWLKQLGARAPKWAALWTYAHLTLDIHSTQRAEAIHSALCHIILASDKLAKVLEKLADFETHRTARRAPTKRLCASRSCRCVRARFRE